MQRRRVLDALRNLFGGDGQRTANPQGGNDRHGEVEYTDGSSYSYSEIDDDPKPANNVAAVSKATVDAKDPKLSRVNPAAKQEGENALERALPISTGQTPSRSRALPSQNGLQNGHNSDGDGSESSRYSLRPRRQRGNFAETKPRRATPRTPRNQHPRPADATSEPLPDTPTPAAPVVAEERESSQTNLRTRQDRVASGTRPTRQLPVVPHMKSARTTSGIVGRPGIVNASDVNCATVSALRNLCKELGLSSSGNKEALKARALEKISESAFHGEETQPLVSGNGKREVGKPLRAHSTGNARSKEMRTADSSAPDSRRETTTTTTATRANSTHRQSEQPAGSRALDDRAASPPAAAQNAPASNALRTATDDNQRSNQQTLDLPPNVPAAAMSSTGFHDFRVNESAVYATADNRDPNACHMPPPSATHSVTQGITSHAQADNSRNILAVQNGGLSAQQTIRELASGTRELINPAERDLCMAFLQGRTVAVDPAKSDPNPTSNAPSNERGHLAIPNRLVGGREMSSNGDRLPTTPAETPGTVTPTQSRASRPPTLPSAPPNTPGLNPGSSAPRGAARRHSLQRNAAEMAANALRQGRSASREATSDLASGAPGRSPDVSQPRAEISGNIEPRVMSRTATHIEGVQLQERNAVRRPNSTSAVNRAPTGDNRTQPSSSPIGRLGCDVDATSPTGRGLPSVFAGAEGGPSTSIAGQPVPVLGSNPVSTGDVAGTPAQRPPPGHPRSRPAAVRLPVGAVPVGTCVADLQQGRAAGRGQLMAPPDRQTPSGPTPSRVTPARPSPARPSPARPTPVRPTPTRTSGFPTPSDIIRTFNRYTPSNRPASTSFAQDTNSTRPAAPSFRRPSSERFGNADFHRLSGSAFGVSLTPGGSQSGPGILRSGPNFNSELPPSSPLFNPKRHSTGMASFRRRAASASGGKLNDLRKTRRSVDFGHPDALQSLNDMYATQKWRQDDRSAAMASSAKKILEALTRTGRENKALVADRTPISPLGPPPSSLKRARDDDDEDLQVTEKRVRRSAADSGMNHATSFARGPSVQRISRPLPSPPGFRGELDDTSRQTQGVLASADKRRRLFPEGGSRSNKRKSMSSAPQPENDVEDVMERVSNRKRRTISYGAASNLGSAFKAYALAQSKAEAERKSGYGTIAFKPATAPRKEPEDNIRAFDRDNGKIGKTGSASNPRASTRREEPLSNRADTEPSAKRPSRANFSSFSFGGKKEEENKPVSKSFSFNPVASAKPPASPVPKEYPVAKNISKANSIESDRIVKVAEKVPSAPKKLNPIISKSPPENDKRASKAVTFAIGDSFAVPAPESKSTENKNWVPSARDASDSGKNSVADAVSNEAEKVERKEQAAKPLPVFTIPNQSAAKPIANEKNTVVPSTSVPVASNSVALFNVPSTSAATPFGSVAAPKAPLSNAAATVAPVEIEGPERPSLETKDGASGASSTPFQVVAPVPETEKVHNEPGAAAEKLSGPAGTVDLPKLPPTVSGPEATATPAAPFTLNPNGANASTGAVEAAKDTKASSIADTPNSVFGGPAPVSNVDSEAKKASEPAKSTPAFGQVPLGAGSGSSFPVPPAKDSLKTGFGAATASSSAKPSFPVPSFVLNTPKPSEPESKPFGFTSTKPAASAFGSSSTAAFPSTASAAFGKSKSTFPTPASTGFGASDSSASGSQGVFAFSAQSSAASAAPASSQVASMTFPSQSTPAFGTSSFGQPTLGSSSSSGNPFSTPGSSAFGGSSAFPSQPSSQSGPKNPFAPTSSAGAGTSSNGPFGKSAFPSSFNPSASAPIPSFTFGATAPPSSSPAASAQTGFGGTSGAQSASAPFGQSASSAGMSFDAPSSGPAATAFGSGTGTGSAFGFGTTPTQTGPSGFASGAQPFGAPAPSQFGARAPSFGGSGLGTQPFGGQAQVPAASLQATQALFGASTMGSTASGDGFSIGSQGTQQRAGRKFLRARRTRK